MSRVDVPSRRIRLVPTESVEDDGCHVTTVRYEADIPLCVDFTPVNGRRIRPREGERAFRGDREAHRIAESTGEGSAGARDGRRRAMLPIFCVFYRYPGRGFNGGA